MPLVLIARVADEMVALDTAGIGSVVELERIAPVPRAAPHVAGLCALRSRVLTVIDGRAAVGLGQVDRRLPSAVTCDVDGHGYALLVDAVEDIVEVADAEPCPVDPAGEWRRVQRGLVQVNGRSMLLVDPLALIAQSQSASIPA